MIIVILSACSVRNSKRIVNPALEKINPEVMKKYVYFLASDSMKGRNTPSRELDSAAKYIANEFEKYGIRPAKGSYFQKIELNKKNLNKENNLTIERNKKENTFNLKDDFIPFYVTADKSIEGQIVFAGYGITASEYDWDDYKNIDVKGKIVFIFQHEPQEKDSLSKFRGTNSTKYSGIDYKVELAAKNGAKGVLVVTDPLNHNFLKPSGFTWPLISRLVSEDELPVNLTAKDKDKANIPVIHVGERIVELLFSGYDSLKRIQSLMDKTYKSNSFEIPDCYVYLKTSVNYEYMTSFNVVGEIEGSDPVLKNEVVVIGAHYDHKGIIKDHEPGEDYIFNGADDNASGTAGVMAIAEAFASAKVKPKRTVLFVLFAGEEKGLYGSYTYVNNPLFPLEKTVAMLNLDMIGRNGADTLFLKGSGRNPGITTVVKKQNKHIGFIIPDNKNDYVGGSDHANFYNHNIPDMFFFTGLHKDYHKVSDSPEKINYAKASRVARLVFKAAWYIANDKKHYEIIIK
ncbi:MAG: M28 family peptidase [Bacteroidales bacterium]|nr:M28 family peptidase [Bacteroidales bacterium]